MNPDSSFPALDPPRWVPLGQHGSFAVLVCAPLDLSDTRTPPVSPIGPLRYQLEPVPS